MTRMRPGSVCAPVRRWIGGWTGGRVEGQDGRCRDQENRSADKEGQLTARHFKVRVEDLRARG